MNGIFWYTIIKTLKKGHFMNYSKYLLEGVGAFIFIFGTFIPQAFGAEERHVAECINTGDGSMATCASNEGGPGAYNTIQDCADWVGPGDTCTVHPGSYPKFELNNGGTSASPITIRSAAKWGAKIDGNLPGGGGAYNFGVHIRRAANYVVLDGFEITNHDQTGVFIRTTNPLDSGGGYFQILNNNIHNNGNGDCEAVGGSGIFEDAHDVLIKGNAIHDNGRSNCLGMGLDHGLYLVGYNQRVQENIIYLNTSNGIKLRPTFGNPIQNPFISNNVIYGQINRNGIIIGCEPNLECTNEYGTIENNIIAQNQKWPIRFYFVGTIKDYLIRNNIFYGNSKGDTIEVTDTVGEVIDVDNIASDPLFINAEAQDFHLQPLSPARDAGVEGVDIGAYPLGGSVADTTPPQPPTGLKFNK
jgi:hypothetical protein